MKDSRLRVNVEGDYLLAIGRATFCFMRLEWMVVWCCEKLQVGWLQKNVNEKHTAGQIAKIFVKLAKASNVKTNEDNQLVTFAEKFKNLALQRNNFLHANPGTAEDGGQRIFRHNQEWTICKLENVADEFTSLEMELNTWYYGKEQ